jgi:hypothetical protein
MNDTVNTQTGTVDPWAGLGDSEPADSRTIDIPQALLDALDYAVSYFATVDSKTLRRVTRPTDAEAELLVDQIHRFSLARGVSTSTLERTGNIVVFRFAKSRSNGSDDS